jgi:hypothetical protein
MLLSPTNAIAVFPSFFFLLDYRQLQVRLRDEQAASRKADGRGGEAIAEGEGQG